MLATLAMKAATSVIHGAESVLGKISTATSLWAGVDEEKNLVSIDLLVNDDELEEILKDPKIVRAWKAAQAVKEVL
jgi:hypothetical protein